MKIAHVQVIPQISGVQQVSLDILKETKYADKFIICGAEMDNSKCFYNAFKEANVEIITIPEIKREIGFHDLKATYKLYKVFKKHGFDVVHTNSTKPAIIGRLAARLAGVDKIIHTVHGIAFHNHVSKPAQIIYRVIENISTLFGHINVTVNKRYVGDYPLVNSKVIYNGVDFEKLNDNDIKKEKDRGVLRIGFMARFEEQKNPIDFIKIAKHVTEKYNSSHELKFVMGGGGELKNQCIQIVKDNNLEHLFEFKGWIRDKSKFLGEIDILVQPSKWEAFGLVFVEAGYLKTPVVSTNIEGIPEVVIHGTTGLLFDDGDVKTGAAHVLSLLENKSMRDQFGENARNRAINSFGLSKMISEYTSLYLSNKQMLDKVQVIKE